MTDDLPARTTLSPERDVRGHDGIAARDELPADLRRSAHHETGGKETVLAQIAVVRNMTNVVELGARTDVSRGQCCAVDRAIAADFHAVADLNIAEVRDLSRPAAGSTA